MSNEPIGLFITPDGNIYPYKIKAKGSRYFVKNNSKIHGLYTINKKHSLKWGGKTPCYIYTAQETNNIDPVMIDRINHWKHKNSLTQIKKKDVKHGRRLRLLVRNNKKSDAMEIIKQSEKELSTEIKEIVKNVDLQIRDDLEKIKSQHSKNIDPTNAEKGLILLTYLKDLEKINDNEFDHYKEKVETNKYTFDMLLDEMKEKHEVDVSEPLDLNVEDFIQDLGAQSASDLAGFCQDIIKGKKGLKDLTPAPVKAFMSAGLLLALLVGGAVILAVGAPYLTGQSTLPTGGEGGLKMPWEMFGFLMGMIK
jgi:hypothetical protein